MKFYQRSLLPVAIAALVPTLVFATVALYFGYLDHRSDIEQAATERARTVMTEVDAQMRADMAALNVLATSPFIDEASWGRYYLLLKRALSLNPHWLGVSVVDPGKALTLLDTQRPSGVMHDADDLDLLRETVKTKKTGFKTALRAADATGLPAVRIFQPVMRNATLRYILVLTISPQIYQNTLLARSTGDKASAIVDKNGIFLARNIDYDKRWGTPATHFVRDAIAQGGTQGFYRGTTYEGFENYTAFYRSALTGWSTHFTVASNLIDGAKSWSFATIGLAAAISLSLAVLLVLIVTKDIADRQRAEDRLRQAQKMEAVGQLTGGIAHDFNNLLTAIIGNLEMLSMRLSGEEKLKRRADNALDAAQRAARLTGQLLAFSRTSNIDRSAVDLARLTEDLSDLLLHSVGSGITLNIDIAQNARYIMGDANQIETALINMAVNARDAMPDGGTLTISTQPYLPEPADNLPQGDFIELCVRDSGCGMSEQTKARALEPFFTTKPVGRGTGLGLSQVFGVVRQSGGDLKIDSTPGVGTTIRMIMPCASPDEIATSLQSANSQDAGAPETLLRLNILVLDDEPAICELICEMLVSLGHRCKTSKNAIEAFKHLETDRFDLMITDFAMPDQNGAQVAREARGRYPHLKVLFMSGFADMDEIERAITGAPILRKPFTAQDLEAALRACLENEEVARASAF